MLIKTVFSTKNHRKPYAKAQREYQLGIYHTLYLSIYTRYLFLSYLSVSADRAISYLVRDMKKAHSQER